jgi:hypothetical protein
MADEEQKLDLLESQFPAAAGAAFSEARARALASGQSVLQSEDGYIYEVFPNGTRVMVKQIEPPIPVVASRKITIR